MTISLSSLTPTEKTTAVQDLTRNQRYRATIPAPRPSQPQTNMPGRVPPSLKERSISDTSHTEPAPRQRRKPLINKNGRSYCTIHRPLNYNTEPLHHLYTLTPKPRWLHAYGRAPSNTRGADRNTDVSGGTMYGTKYIQAGTASNYANNTGWTTVKNITPPGETSLKSISASQCYTERAFTFETHMYPLKLHFLTPNLKPIIHNYKRLATALQISCWKERTNNQSKDITGSGIDEIRNFRTPPNSIWSIVALQLYLSHEQHYMSPTNWKQAHTETAWCRIVPDSELELDTKSMESA